MLLRLFPLFNHRKKPENNWNRCKYFKIFTIFPHDILLVFIYNEASNYEETKHAMQCNWIYGRGLQPLICVRSSMRLRFLFLNLISLWLLNCRSVWSQAQAFFFVEQELRFLFGAKRIFTKVRIDVFGMKTYIIKRLFMGDFQLSEHQQWTMPLFCPKMMTNLYCHQFCCDEEEICITKQ